MTIAVWMELKEYLESKAKNDTFIPAVYCLIYNELLAIEAKYACESLKEAGY